jgi:hypothetical protein
MCQTKLCSLLRDIHDVRHPVLSSRSEVLSLSKAARARVLRDAWGWKWVAVRNTGTDP